MSYELYTRLIKEYLEDNKPLADSGQIPKDQVVDIAVERLAAMDDSDINKAIETFLDQKKNLTKKVLDAQKEYNTFIDESYDQIMKDL